ncbi:GNAT family N-acetyltransferase [Runella slithyformis]|uniref:GCN5-related N-acetyltransferase n=1 Tax=Runella slithyformis (strain ATCC 29530 / DSM 19594 / LMG 11500 / NCIMB 11436 / LSU 4) TaxID=761193 RepID=A0A7U4E7X9_RUNSL|nr:GNAT family N-acetyltransferase [Runella slithyformis]AEI51108.1 GCN5-related N-acetyltransferase [Runella slithyformis DSM 19594]
MLTIRAAQQSDQEAVWAIIEPVIRAGDTYMYSPDTSKEKMLALWFDAEKYTYVAEKEGRLAGTFFLKANQPDLGSHVVNAGYMVHPAYRGRGIAEQLCRFSLEEARRLGFKAMQFNCVISTNTVAVRLWQKCGFDIVGTLPKAFQHKELGFTDAYVMYQWLE